MVCISHRKGAQSFNIPAVTVQTIRISVLILADVATTSMNLSTVAINTILKRACHYPQMIVKVVNWFMHLFATSNEDLRWWAKCVRGLHNLGSVTDISVLHGWVRHNLAMKTYKHTVVYSHTMA